MSQAVPEDHKGRLHAMEMARKILTEHFDLGFVVVSHEENGVTRFAKTEWGNDFGICHLSQAWASGDLDNTETDDDDVWQDSN